MNKKTTHATHTTKDGALVLVLNTEASITPEAEAMLQALHSRSIGGIHEHLEVLGERGAEKFMSTYYVGYGHKSIGDCGSATVFVEGISMLTAKAIQDWPLYSGQESSTRYIDYSEQLFLNPIQTKEGEEVQEAWRTFYLKGLTELIPVLKERYPLKVDENESVYEKAIAARSFDTMRAFLPAGATTNVAWHMNLRQFSDALLSLRHHPLEEVRTVALGVEEALLQAYPNSFSKKRYKHTEIYNEAHMKDYYFTDVSCPDFALERNTLDTSLLNEYQDLLVTRPAKTELPRRIAECGTLQFRFLLDFGSFRDLQRHRAVTQRMPLLTSEHGFNEWYLGELPDALQKEARELIETQNKRITTLQTTPYITQYYLPMGFQMPNRLTGDLRALLYLIEIRATRFVHPTLRARAREMAGAIAEVLGTENIAIHLDTEPDRFDLKRGEHDIIKNKNTEK